MWSPELLARARRRQDASYLLVGGFFVIVLPTIILVLLLTAPFDALHSGRAVRLALTLVLVPAALAITVITLMLRGRRRRVAWLQPVPLGGADRETRQRVVQAIRSGAHLDDRFEEDLALDLAARWAAQARAQLWVAAILLLAALIQVVLQEALMMVVFLMAGVFFLMQFWVLRWRAERYLTATAKER